eukprot:1158003-Pelagomonas_calceolata.AAC.1
MRSPAGGIPGAESDIRMEKLLIKGAVAVGMEALSRLVLVCKSMNARHTSQTSFEGFLSGIV